MIKQLAKMAVVSLLGLYSTVAYPDYPIPEKGPWEAMAITNDPPVREVFMGPGKVISGIKERNPNASIYLMWWKAVYKEAQKSEKGIYKTEIMLIKIDCPRQQYVVMRDIRYASDGIIIMNIKKPGKSKFLDVKFEGDGGKLPLDEEFAYDSVEWTCFPGDH